MTTAKDSISLAEVQCALTTMKNAQNNKKIYKQESDSLLYNV